MNIAKHIEMEELEKNSIVEGVLYLRGQPLSIGPTGRRLDEFLIFRGRNEAVRNQIKLVVERQRKSYMIDIAKWAISPCFPEEADSEVTIMYKVNMVDL